MAGRPIKRWNTDPNSSPEPELVYADGNQVGPDYAYGAEALEAFRKDLGLSASAPEESRSGVVRDIHKCQRPPVSRHGVGTVFYCEDCDLYSELERYLPSRRSRSFRFRWVVPGIIRQGYLRRRYG